MKRFSSEMNEDNLKKLTSLISSHCFEVFFFCLAFHVLLLWLRAETANCADLLMQFSSTDPPSPPLTPSQQGSLQLFYHTSGFSQPGPPTPPPRLPFPSLPACSIRVSAASEVISCFRLACESLGQSRLCVC